MFGLPDRREFRQIGPKCLKFRQQGMKCPLRIGKKGTKVNAENILKEDLVMGGKVVLFGTTEGEGAGGFSVKPGEEKGDK